MKDKELYGHIIEMKEILHGIDLKTTAMKVKVDTHDSDITQIKVAQIKQSEKLEDQNLKIAGWSGAILVLGGIGQWILNKFF